MRKILLWAVVAAAAAATPGCATGPAFPPAQTAYGRADCAARPDFGAALSLAVKKEKAAQSVVTPISETTSCLQWNGRATPYAVYALPADVSDKTFEAGGLLEGARIFAPEVTLMSADGAVTRTLSRDQFLYRGAVYSVQFRARPEERYVLVTAAPELVGKAYNSIAIGTTTTTVPIGTGTATWTSGVDNNVSRTFSYTGSAQVSVYDSDVKNGH